MKWFKVRVKGNKNFISVKASTKELAVMKYLLHSQRNSSPLTSPRKWGVKLKGGVRK